MNKLEYKKREVTQLLQDFMNFMPLHDEFPITPEAELRMDRSTLVGETYGALDDAMLDVKHECAEGFRAIQRAYLHDEAGHSDVAHWRRAAQSERERGAPGKFGFMVAAHDVAIELLARKLLDRELFVRFPPVVPDSPGYKPIEERHEEVRAAYRRHREGGAKHSQAVAGVSTKTDYSRKQVERIVNACSPDADGEAR